MFLVIEIQTAADGTIAHIVNNKATINEAESTYHQILASAALSNIAKHGAVILTDEGYPLKHSFYDHTGQPEPEE